MMTMTAEQLNLDLPRRTALGRADFLVSDANMLALAMLDGWQDWQLPRLALAGPKGSGKSHLARVWAEESGATVLDCTDLAAFEARGIDVARPLVVEDADHIGLMAGENLRRSELALLHIHNALGEAATPMVLTGIEPPARWSIALPDLASRLAAVPVARIEAPDFRLLQAILVKLFADRQIHVAPDLIAYLLLRIDRDGTSAERVVEALDRAAMRERRAITRPFAADTLRRLGLGCEPS